MITSSRSEDGFYPVYRPFCYIFILTAILAFNNILPFNFNESIPVIAANYTVSTSEISGPGSLSEAINLANNNPGTDTITFEVPINDTDSNGSDIVSIDIPPVVLGEQGFLIEENLVIDGASQRTSQYGGSIRLNGQNTQLFNLSNSGSSPTLDLIDLEFVDFNPVVNSNGGTLRFEGNKVISQSGFQNQTPGPVALRSNGSNLSIISNTFNSIEALVSVTDISLTFSDNNVYNPLGDGINYTSSSATITGNTFNIGSNGVPITFQIDESLQSGPYEIKNNALFRVSGDLPFIDTNSSKYPEITQNSFYFTEEPTSFIDSAIASTSLTSAVFQNNELTLTGSSIYPIIELQAKIPNPSTTTTTIVSPTETLVEGSQADSDPRVLPSLPTDPIGTTRNAFSFTIPFSPFIPTETIQLAYYERSQITGENTQLVTDLSPFIPISLENVQQIDTQLSLTISNTQNRDFLPGDIVNLTATVQNNSANAIPQAFALISLPGGIVPVINQNGSVSIDTQSGILTWEVGDISAGQTVQLVLSGTVRAGVGGQSFPYSITIDSRNSSVIIPEEQRTVTGIFEVGVEPNTTQVTPENLNGGSNIASNQNQQPVTGSEQNTGVTNVQPQVSSLPRSGGDMIKELLPGIGSVLIGLTIALVSSLFHKPSNENQSKLS